MRWSYSHLLNPPALIVPIRIKSVYGNDLQESVAKIDTGADLTVIPEAIKKRLYLKSHIFRECKGSFDTEPIIWPTFFVSIEIDNGFSFDLEVISTERNDALIGRDLLNQIVLHADGPSSFFEINQS